MGAIYRNTKERLHAFGHVFSEEVRSGGKLRMMGTNNVPREESNILKAKIVQRTVIMMEERVGQMNGRYLQKYRRSGRNRQVHPQE